MCDYAYENGLIAEDGIVYRDLFDTKVELLHEIEQLAERGMVYLHGHMLIVEHDAVLVVVHIGRILEAPLAAVYGHGPKRPPIIITGSARIPTTSADTASQRT